MAPCEKNHRGETLKNEGNILHQEGKYRAAYHKYTEAIKEDPKNAVYYANRAACSLALKEYMDAFTDAKKSAELDSNYAKAWARMGTAKFALTRWNDSVEAWKKALACLPPQDQFTESDKRLHIQFTEGLQKAENALQGSKFPDPQFFSKDQKMPWQRAEEMIEQLRAEKKESSGFVIAHAYWEFKKGVETMKALAEKPTPTGQLTIVGKPEALVDISNGFMRDPRVFHMDCSDWFDKYNKQAMFECQLFKAWKDAGAKAIIDEAPKKQKRDGWDSTRNALAITIRAWIICGIFATAAQKPTVAVEYHSRVVEVLNWGSRVWADVPAADRGCIFEWTFIRGAKRLQIMAIHEALASGAKDCPFTRDELAEQCRELIAESEARPPSPSDPLDPGFYLSFWVYPRAEALAILGWCHMQTGLKEANDSQSASSAFARAAEFYLGAAKSFPSDDEKALVFATVALEAYCFGNRSLRDVVIVTMWINDLVPKTGQLWEHSQISESRNAQALHAQQFGLKLVQAKIEGRVTETSIVKPKALKSQDKWAAPDVLYL